MSGYVHISAEQIFIRLWKCCLVCTSFPNREISNFHSSHSKCGKNSVHRPHCAIDHFHFEFSRRTLPKIECAACRCIGCPNSHLLLSVRLDAMDFCVRARVCVTVCVCMYQSEWCVQQTLICVRCLEHRLLVLSFDVAANKTEIFGMLKHQTNNEMFWAQFWNGANCERKSVNWKRKLIKFH